MCGKQASFLILYLSIIFKGYYGQNEGSFTNICNLPDFVFFKKYLNDVESITGHFCHQWFVLLWPKLHSPNVPRAANDDDIRVMMIATSRVTLIVPACKPGWEDMENLRQSSYLSQISQIIFVEKNCHVEIFWKTLGLFVKF